MTPPSATQAADCAGTRSDRRIAAKHHERDAGRRLPAGRISKAWPLAFPALSFSAYKLLRARSSRQRTRAPLLPATSSYPA